MASVAICPHCYLQLVVPDGVERDARVECPTCAKAFDLTEAVLRAIPAVRVIERAESPPAVTPAAETPAELMEARESDPTDELPDEPEPADEAVAAWFRAQETVPEVSAAVEEETPAETDLAGDEATAEVEIAEEPAAVEANAPPRPATVTLADLLPRAESSGEPLGPSFDLPNVPLAPDNGATVEFGAEEFGPGAATEFELDGVDFESVPSDETASDFKATSRPPDTANAPPAPFVIPAVPPARRKRSVLRTLAGTALGAMVGLPLGYMVLLYFGGPSADFLDIAHYLPSAILPGSFESEPARFPVALSEPAPQQVPAIESEGTAIDPVEESKDIPAGYVETLEATDSTVDATLEDDSAVGDRYASEPSRIEEPPAAPLAAELPRPSGPTFSTQQLAAAVQNGRAASNALAAGNLDSPESRRAMGQGYVKLADLANALVFVDRSQSSETQELDSHAESIFRELLSDADTREQVNRVAGVWIDSPHRQHGGIFLAGNASDGQIAGDVYEFRFHANDSGDLVLLTSEPLDDTGQLLGIVGVVIDHPADAIPGYTGAAERAIWVQRAIPLSQRQE